MKVKVIFLGFLFLVTNGLFGEFGQERKFIDVSSLRLYSLLLDIKSVIQKFEPQDSSKAPVLDDPLNNDVTKNFLTPIQIVDTSVQLMQEIVDALNGGLVSHNPEIEYKFVNMCNTLRDVAHIEQRHLRILKKKIIKFDQYIQGYCLNNKRFFERDSKIIDLFNKMTKLDYYLLNVVLCDEFLDNTFANKVADVFMYRPYEWVCDHPWLTTTVVFVGIGLVTWWWIWPMIEEKRKAGQGDITVVQIRVIPQKGLSCGVSAVHNLCCLASADDPEKMRKLAQDEGHFERFKKLAEDDLGTVESLTGGQLEKLAVKQGFAKASLEIIDGKEFLERYVAHDKDVADCEKMEQFKTQLKEGRPVYFLVNTARLPEKASGMSEGTAFQKSYGHWLPVKVTRDETVKSGMRFFTANSLENYDLHSSDIFSQLQSVLS